MKLTTLSMKNFMPFRGVQQMTFPADAQQNVMVVFGDNMRGKTSLLNALRWGFYGAAMTRHLRPIETHQIHNRDAAAERDWEFEVVIEFEADGHAYELRRKATKKSLVATPERAEDFEVVLGLSRDGSPLPAYQIASEINRMSSNDNRMGDSSANV